MDYSCLLAEISRPCGSLCARMHIDVFSQQNKERMFMSEVIDREVVVEHDRSLCHKPDMAGQEGKFISFEEFETNPPPCLCCGAPLQPRNLLSLGFQRLGIYEVICPVCP